MSRTAAGIIVQCEQKKKISMPFPFLGLLIRGQVVRCENDLLSNFRVTDHDASLFSYLWMCPVGENAAFPSKEQNQPLRCLDFSLFNQLGIKVFLVKENTLMVVSC